MFFKKSTLALGVVALANIVSAAETPACILDVMANTKNPADLSSICGPNSQQVQAQISAKCGATTQMALQFYANTCQEHGYKVDISSSSSSNSNSGNSNNSGNSDNSNNSNNSGNSNDSNSSGTSNNSGSATTTGSGFVTAVSTSGAQATGSSGGASGTSSGAASSASGSSTASSAAQTGAAVSDRQLSGTAFAAAVFIGAAALL